MRKIIKPEPVQLIFQRLADLCRNDSPIRSRSITRQKFRAHNPTFSQLTTAKGAAESLFLIQAFWLLTEDHWKGSQRKLTIACYQGFWKSIGHLTNWVHSRTWIDSDPLHRVSSWHNHQKVHPLEMLRETTIRASFVYPFVGNLNHFNSLYLLITKSNLRS